MPQDNRAEKAVELSGAWELRFIAADNQQFSNLYPRQKPFLVFENKGEEFSGSTGCNSFAGAAEISGDKIRFPFTLSKSRMVCPGNGEQVFLDGLRKVNRYRLQGKELSLCYDSEVVMRFEQVE